MYEVVLNVLEQFLPEGIVKDVTYYITLAVLVLICILVRLIIKWVVVRMAGRMVAGQKYKWGSILFQNKVFHRLTNVVIPIGLSAVISSLPGENSFLAKVNGVIGVWIFLLIFDAVLHSADQIYRLYEISKTRPIRGLLQVIKVAVYIISGIIAVAVLAGESPVVLLGGIGAMTAVTSLIFKDAILGFVAGIQLTANDMIRIGDWIEMPKCNADGTVIDLSMTTIKVENFDKTITAIPAYMLVSDAFINWRGMENSGGRRIKRAIYIDAAGVQLCDDAMIERFRNIELIRRYIKEKQIEIEQHNESFVYDAADPVNGRKITNIGTFRAYVSEYLKHHPGIHKDMTIMVRQLSPDDRGLPLEIYAFTNTTKWGEYEGIQSDIFDHLYAVASEFGLQIYQKPSGSDVRSIGNYKS